MTEKRWIIHKISNNSSGLYDLVDTQEKESYPFDADYDLCETAIDILNRLSEENKNLSKLNHILEGFLLSKGYDFNDIKFLQERTEE